MRALITNFHITSLIWKVYKNKNLLGIAIVLIGRYGGHKWHRFWFKGVDAREEFPLSTGFWLARLGSKYKS